MLLEAVVESNFSLDENLQDLVNELLFSSLLERVNLCQRFSLFFFPTVEFSSELSHFIFEGIVFLLFLLLFVNLLPHVLHNRLNAFHQVVELNQITFGVYRQIRIHAWL